MLLGWLGPSLALAVSGRLLENLGFLGGVFESRSCQTLQALNHPKKTLNPPKPPKTSKLNKSLKP